MGQQKRNIKTGQRSPQRKTIIKEHATVGWRENKKGHEVYDMKNVNYAP